MNEKAQLIKAAKSGLTKKIVLFGVGKFSVNFFEEFSKELNIVRAVSNIQSEWGEKAFLGKLDVSRFDVNDISDDEYIVVCGPVAFEQIEPQLCLLGLRMFYDFLDFRLVATIIHEKKLALFRGSCILRDIYNTISARKVFSQIYESVFVPDNYTIHKYDKKIVYYCVQICDLYIYSYRMLRQDQVHIIDKSELPEDCKMLSVSNISFGGFWPQTKSEMVEYNENMLIPYNIERNSYYYHMTYRDNDSNINALMDEGKSYEEIYKILSDEDFYTEKEVSKNLKIGFKSIAIAEKFCEIKVLDYIKENYISKRLFQDNMHMNKHVIWEYVHQIYANLEIDDSLFEEEKQAAPEYVHHGGDQPIYPSVIKKLGLEWIDENYKYEIMTYYGVAKMTFYEYIKHYVQYSEAAREVRKMWEV